MRDLLFSNLRRDRMRAGLRLRDASNETGISVSKLSEAERGLINLTPEEAERVRAAIEQGQAAGAAEPKAAV